jgi:hypothetical protein
VIDPASFRDPAGFVFRRDGVLHRQVQQAAAADWEAYWSSGLHERLLADRLVIEFEEAPLETAALPGAIAVLRPRMLELVSHP